MERCYAGGGEGLCRGLGGGVCTCPSHIPVPGSWCRKHHSSPGSDHAGGAVCKYTSLCKQVVSWKVPTYFPLGVVSNDNHPLINKISSGGFARWPLEPEMIKRLLKVTGVPS